MVKLAVEEGLCVTCKNNPGCTYPRNAVTRCAEFEEFAIRPVAVNGRPSQPEETYCGDYMGLCRSCEDRDICLFPRPEGGVWRCDEYR